MNSDELFIDCYQALSTKEVVSHVKGQVCVGTYKNIVDIILAPKAPVLLSTGTMKFIDIIVEVVRGEEVYSPYSRETEYLFVMTRDLKELQSAKFLEDMRSIDYHIERNSHVSTLLADGRKTDIYCRYRNRWIVVTEPGVKNNPPLWQNLYRDCGMTLLDFQLDIAEPFKKSL